jgi:hypothetical protein
MKNFTRILFLLVLVSLILDGKVHATISGSLDSAGYKLLADYIYDFQKFSDSPSGSLCVYGSDDVASSIVSRYSDVVVLKDTHAKQCRLVYVAEDQVRSLSEFMADFNKQKIPTISFIDGFTESEGTFYAEIVRGGKIKLQLNPRVKALGIKISPLVLNLINN